MKSTFANRRPKPSVSVTTTRTVSSPSTLRLSTQRPCPLSTQPAVTTEIQKRQFAWLSAPLCQGLSLAASTNRILTSSVRWVLRSPRLKMWFGLKTPTTNLESKSDLRENSALARMQVSSKSKLLVCRLLTGRFLREILIWLRLPISRDLLRSSRHHSWHRQGVKLFSLGKEEVNRSVSRPRLRDQTLNCNSLWPTLKDI